MNHLDRHSILTEAQHGFRQQRSCETQLITTYYDILKQLDDQNVQKVDAVVLDFAKAFVKVPHKRLATKLKYYGITGPILEWITAFLSNRTQRVLLDGSSSDPVPVTSGVPQGTVLGPLLFILYINDLPEITVESKVRLYADDSLIYKAIKSADDSRDLQNDLDALGRWAEKWLMIFRPDKCKLMSFTRSHSPTEFQYTLNNVNIQATDTHKYLGVHLSCDTKFNEHIDKIFHKANQKLGFLRRNLHSCSREIKHTAYDTLVRPGLEYCAGVWDPHTKTCIDKLEKITTKAADQFNRLPYSGVPMAGTPPAAYWMPTLTNAKPIIVTTRPVTSGGNANRILPMNNPSTAWNNPPTITPPNRAASPSTPLPATSGIMIGKKANDVPWTMGRAAPTGPIVIVWISVAMPAKSIDIWLR